jgi:hypothetical protein
MEWNGPERERKRENKPERQERERERGNQSNPNRRNRPNLVNQIINVPPNESVGTPEGMEWNGMEWNGMGSRRERRGMNQRERKENVVVWW